MELGKTPVFTTEDVPAFSEDATRGNAHMSPASLDSIMASLTMADIPTLERAVRAIDDGELAWLGFKVVYDAALAVNNVDNAVTKKYGEVGSADGEPLLFFCNDAKEIVCSRPVSDRDVFQMKDVTQPVPPCTTSNSRASAGRASRSSIPCVFGCSVLRTLPS